MTSAALPQLCPLQSPAADKLRVVYETGRGVTPPVNLAEGSERETSVPFRYAPTPQGRGVPPRKGQRVDVGGHALLPQHVPSASAFHSGLKPGVSRGVFL